MTVVSLFHLDVLPDRVDDALAVLHRILRDTRQVDGCHEATVLRDDADPAHLVVLARWASAADHDAYLEWRSGDGAPTDLPPLLASAPTAPRFVVEEPPAG